MHDGAEVRERGRVGEDQVGDGGAPQGAVAVEDLRAEALDHRRQHRLAGRLELAHDRVGVDHHRPALGEHRRHRRLPRPDAPREPDQQHRATVAVAATCAESLAPAPDGS
ncbi:MAG: hypothetical protein R2711_15180 [Acidimicrobiales bacterium]